MLKSELQLASIQYNFPKGFLRGLILLPFFILFFQILLTFPDFYEYILIFWGENKLLENVQFILFSLGVILSLRMTWLTKTQVEKPFVWAFYLLFSFGLFFIAMEEIAWGQQFLQFNTPEIIKDFNAQNEFTLHNVEFLQDRTDFLNLIFGLGGLFGLWLSSQRKFHMLGIPAILSPWFIMIFLLSSLGVFNDFYSVSTQFDYSLHKQTETVELLIAGGTFLFVWVNLRACASFRRAA